MRKLNRTLQAVAAAAFYLSFSAAVNAQATPTPAPVVGSGSGYEITSTVEVGYRGIEVNGNSNKFRSDLNYRAGARLFDSSFLIDDNTSGPNVFDKALIIASGWGSDPSGNLRFNMEKTGIYKFDSNLRKVKYFNSLNNHALNLHNANTTHHFGDVDLTIFPESPKFRVRLGFSSNLTSGPAGFTTRAYGDEFGVMSDVKVRSEDFRAGVDGKMLGFDLGVTVGRRNFRENTRYFIEGLNLGSNPTNTARLFSFERRYPIRGATNFGQFNAQRTFAKRLDFTARFIYSETKTRFSVDERLTGRDNSNNNVDLDQFAISGDATRPQYRGDLGLTYRITDNFRISNSFTYDHFNIAGGNTFFEGLYRRNAAGTTTLPPVFTNTTSHRMTGYKRLSNLIEADYQFNNRFALNFGYRYTDRKIELQGLDRNLATTTPVSYIEDFENKTHSVIAGLMAKPMKNWVVYADVEHGNADSVFTRLGNNDFTNFRIRTRASFNTVAFNASFISKDNNNPSRSIEVPPRDFTVDTTNRTFTASVDWNPRKEFSFSTGYTYQHLNSYADIIVPVAGARLQGVSEYYVRDSYFFFDVSAQPVKRLSFFASYRINDDGGQGDRISTRAQDLVTSYPMRMHSPEVRVALKITRNIDWNIGYQYYDYRETFLNAQNYSAHLPYTSLRFYFGRAASDR